jgi:NAD kinase
MFQNAAIVINAAKRGALQFAELFKNQIGERGIGARFFSEYPIDDGVLREHDIIIAVGGDGTIIGVAIPAAKLELPVFAVKLRWRRFSGNDGCCRFTG